MGVLDRLLGRPLDRVAFARRAVREVVRAGMAGADEIIVDDDAFALRVGEPAEPGKESGTFFLGNLYAEYLATPRGGRDSVFVAITANVAAMRSLSPTVSLDEAQANLRLQLRPRVFALTNQTVYRVVAERLAMVLCLDSPTAIRYVSPSDLAGWGADEDTAFTIARANLERDTAGALQPLGNGVYGSPWEDTYDAARALLPHVIRRVPAPGGHAVAVPHRNLLLVADRGDPAALASLLRLTDQAANNPRMVSRRVLSLEGDDLVPLVLSPDHPLAAELRRLDRLDLQAEYVDQKATLEEQHARDGVDVYVASFDLLRDRQEQIHSWSSWAEGVDTLLPVSDLVALSTASAGGQPSEIVGLFPFERVQAVAGAHLRPVEGYPTRYRVTSFPTAEEIAALGPPVEP